MSNAPKHTALYLLERIIEYVNMTSDESEWTFEEQKGNPPRYARLQQIRSLMEAFIPELMATENIRKSIVNFFAGGFIIHRTTGEYSYLLGQIHQAINESRFIGVRKNNLDVQDLQTNFCNLMDYYLKLKNLLNHNHSDMDISCVNMFSNIVTGTISGLIYSEAESLSNLLVEFIDPGNHAYTEDELVEQFNYPAVDLLDLDLQWM